MFGKIFFLGRENKECLLIIKTFGFEEHHLSEDDDVDGGGGGKC